MHHKTFGRPVSSCEWIFWNVPRDYFLILMDLLNISTLDYNANGLTSDKTSFAVVLIISESWGINKKYAAYNMLMDNGSLPL